MPVGGSPLQGGSLQIELLSGMAAAGLHCLILMGVIM